MLTTSNPNGRRKATGSPLTSAEIATFDSARSNLRANFGQSLVERTRGVADARQTFRTNRNTLGLQRNDAEYGLRGQLTGRGLATDPMFAGQGIADLNTAWGQSLTQARQDRTRRIDALNAARDRARMAMEQGLTQVDNEAAVRRADMARLIRSVGGIQ